MLRYTPHLAILDDHALALEIEGSLRLFGGVRALLRAVRRDCPPGTVTGLAPTALGACLLARSSRGTRHVLRPETLSRRLDALPCAALPVAPDTLAALQALGCRRLGALRALPRVGLRNRGYAALIETLDRAYGRATPQAHDWLTNGGGFAQACELPRHSASATVIEAASAPLIAALCAWLDAHQDATSLLELDLFHDDRRLASPITSVRLRTARPEWDAARFTGLLREHLARRRLEAPVVGLALRCTRVEPRAPRTAPLLLDDSPPPGREAALLDMLRARLGMDCLSFPDPVPQHIPERTDRWRAKATLPRARLPELASRSRPLWLLAQAIALTAPAHRPMIGGAPLALISGPERIEGGWWVHGQAPVGRDYFIARDARGARYWIYRDHRGTGWFLHGLFG
ncbi:DNA polymerase Y family protein [Castellaniella sp. GW247-6E4]|uniref:Y-family DNA polymerase n=1 Tax=Castellaniella sp. GW247-6E4 TaxID=3140380 RepID=UPI003314BAC2